jgi:23S rRNA (cytosine1962-C5)-methyltransferase
MSEKAAVISPRGVDRLRAGHLWIYRTDMIQCDSDPGSIVSVRDRKGRFYGKAFYSSSSLINLRLLTSQDIEIDRKFWRCRLQQALELRQLVVSDTEVYRLVHGEGDGLPSVIVDRYGDVFCIQTLSQGADHIKSLLVDLLLELFQPKAVIERNDSKVRKLEGLQQIHSVLYGEAPDELICLENGLRFQFQPLSGQKTGAFLDQRENRAWARKLAHGRALDCFCYAGSFAMHLARSCEQVEALDVSEPAVQAGQRNAELNGFSNVRFEVENAFDRLKLYDHLKKRFDTIVLDPPAFAKNRAHIEAASRAYREINLRALRLLNPGGLLVTASCSQLIDETYFLNLLTQAATDAKRKVQVIQKRTQSQDHPFLLSMPETYYLKCLFLRVLD